MLGRIILALVICNVVLALPCVNVTLGEASVCPQDVVSIFAHTKGSTPECLRFDFYAELSTCEELLLTADVGGFEEASDLVHQWSMHFPLEFVAAGVSMFRLSDVYSISWSAHDGLLNCGHDNYMINIHYKPEAKSCQRSFIVERLWGDAISANQTEHSWLEHIQSLH